MFRRRIAFMTPRVQALIFAVAILGFTLSVATLKGANGVQLALVLVFGLPMAALNAYVWYSKAPFVRKRRE